MGHFSPTYKFSDIHLMTKSNYDLSEHNQVMKSLQQINMSNDDNMSSLIKSSEKQLNENLKSVREIHGNQMNAINSMVRSNTEINNTINKGLNSLYDGLDNLSGQLNLHLSALIEQYKISNSKLNEIYQYIKLPEFEKERIFYIEQGFDFLKQTLINHHRYTDALESFLNAYKINNKDFIVSNQIGLIYLYGEDHIDIAKSINFFEHALDYAHSAQQNKLYVNIGKHLAYAYLLCGDIEKLLNITNKILNNNSNKEIEYLKAEGLAIKGDYENSHQLLFKLFEKDNKFYSNTIENPNFKYHEFDDFIKKYNELYINKLIDLKKNVWEDYNNNINYFNRIYVRDVWWDIKKLINSIDGIINDNPSIPEMVNILHRYNKLNNLFNKANEKFEEKYFYFEKYFRLNYEHFTTEEKIKYEKLGSTDPETAYNSLANIINKKIDKSEGYVDPEDIDGEINIVNLLVFLLSISNIIGCYMVIKDESYFVYYLGWAVISATVAYRGYHNFNDSIKDKIIKFIPISVYVICYMIIMAKI